MASDLLGWERMFPPCIVAMDLAHGLPPSPMPARALKLVFSPRDALVAEDRQGTTRPGLSRPKVHRRNEAGFTLVEVMIAAAVLAITAVTSTQALLQLNRQAAVVRVMNAAKAAALSRIQQVSQCAYNPTASPAVVPALLTVGTTTSSTDLGSTSTDLGSIPATVTWVVANVAGQPSLLSVRCRVNYTYLGRNLTYELFTYKAAD